MTIFDGWFSRAGGAVRPEGPVVISSPPAPANLGQRVLRLGVASGADVAWLQARLGLKPDGIFGPITRAAVEAWQAANDLVVDGVVGRGSWERMGIETAAAPPVFTPPVPMIAERGFTSRVQRALEACKPVVAVFDPLGWAPVIAREMAANDMTGRIDASCALACFIHETGGLRLLVENLHYTSPERLVANWPRRFPTIESATPYLRNAPALAERVYGGRMGNDHPGDGWLYRGRGLIQVTGATAYRQLAADIGLPVPALIAMMETREGAAKTACAWWRANGISRIATERGPVAARERVNGGKIGMKEFLALQPLVYAALAEEG